MVQKESLHLGQEVLFGQEREKAVVDALSQSSIGLAMKGGKYVVGDYKDVYAE